MFIDGILRADLRPLAPLSELRLLYDIVGIEAQHLACLASAVIGGAGCLLPRKFRKPV